MEKIIRETRIHTPSLLDIHLKSHLLYESEPDEQRDNDGVYALSAIAFFILAIAWITIINLATARSLNLRQRSWCEESNGHIPAAS